jgi:hypothetical protein
MKFLNRLLLASLAVIFAMSLCVTAATAQTSSSKKKKKAAAVAAEKKAERKAERKAEKKVVIEGGNLSGKPGYIISDTAAVLNQGQVMGAVHLSFDTWGNVLQIPIGVSYGITDKIMLNVNTGFYSYGGNKYTIDGVSYGASGTSGINYLNFGGKYGWKNVGDNTGLDIAAGLDFAIGPLSNLYGYTGAFAFDPYGVVTYTLKDGLQLNGKLGLYVQTYSFPTDLTAPEPTSISESFSYFQLDLGVAYPFSRDLTGMGELATNGVIGNGALGGGTPLVVGLRTGKDVQFQGFAGLDLGGTVGLYLGGGIVLLSN